jgi:hypothetical protein
MANISVEVNEENVPLLVEFLTNLKFVRGVKIEKKNGRKNSDKTEILNHLKEAVEEVKLIRAGKLKGIKAKDLLNEL